jgi:hypothetical protein
MHLFSNFQSFLCLLIFTSAICFGVVRNHKSLLDEVMRLEELTGDLIARMQKTESDSKVRKLDSM